MPTKFILNKLKDWLPLLLRKHIQDEGKITEIMADLEKERLSSFSGIIERGGISHLFYMYSLLLVNNHILVPYITAFTGKQIYVLPIPEELTYLIMALGGMILGKKVVDKKIS